MAGTLDDILPNALALSDESKLLLAERLIESVEGPEPLDDELAAEVARRRAEVIADPSILIDGDSVLREVRADIAVRRARQ